jgi:hypothetical protein
MPDGRLWRLRLKGGDSLYIADPRILSPTPLMHPPLEGRPSLLGLLRSTFVR